VISHPAFVCEPWSLRAVSLDLAVLAQTESIFALSNGHIGWRGNLDEGEPHGLPGSYLNGVYELRPLPYAEAGYGYPESGQTVINVTNGKVIRLLVDDEPFDVRYGELRAHHHRLDFRAGVLHRGAEWVSPAGCVVRVSSTRLVSFTQRSIAAICYDVEPLESPVRVVVQSELVANEQSPPPGGDPRVAAVLQAPVVEQEHAAKGARAGLVHSTRHSGLCVAAVMDHVIDGPPATRMQAESFPHLGRVTVTASLEPGVSGCGWSNSSPTAGRDPARFPPCVISPTRRSPGQYRQVGTVCSPRSGPTSTRSGLARTCRSTGTPRSSKQCASRCSTCCRPVLAPKAERSPPRA
jgi:alpha,alpha-trehalose phosphorylase